MSEGIPMLAPDLPFAARQAAGAWARLALLALLSGCSSGSTGRTVTIGGLLDVTGNVAEQGTEMLMAAQLAVEEINAAGGVSGAQLVLDNRNPNWSETQVGAQLRELADAGVGVIIGPTASKLSVAGAEVAAARKVVLISGWSTTAVLTDVADDGYFFRTIPSDALQGRVLAQRARERSLQRAAVVYAPHAYGESLSAMFTTEFEALGGSVVHKEAYAEGENVSYLDLVERLRSSGADTIVLAAYVVEGAKILKLYADTYPDQRAFWYLPDGCAEARFITLVGAEIFDRLSYEFTSPTVAPSALRSTFEASFSKRYGRAPLAGSTGGIQTYDAVYLSALALSKAGATTGTAIRDALPLVANPPGTVFDPAHYADAVRALRAGEDIDYRGASGELDFDSAGDVLGPYAILKVAEGQLVQEGDPVSPR